LGIARELASNGADVVINGFGDAQAIEKERVNIELEFAVKAHYINADLSRADATRAFVDEAARLLGGGDMLVNNAGVQDTDLIDDFPVEPRAAIIALNLSAVYHGTAAALPYMNKQGWGRIINIASAHGLVASAAKSAYVAAKHGVVGLTKVTALENAGNGITANAICPRWVRTPLVEKQIEAIAQAQKVDIDEAARRLLSEKQPSLQIVTPKQIGGMAVFLASESAEQITGAPMSIEGGWTAR